ncbi:MAG: hypothetical protein RIR09_2636 [Pseudomonadota bacterium]|jgi:molecular chaperone DnaJ
MKSFYEILEVSPGASDAVIRSAYRCLSQHAHPDKNPDSQDAGLRMLSINRAYSVLSDLEKRKEYDLSQCISQSFCERRGDVSLSPTTRVLRGKVPPSDRPFAFRPLD